MPKTFDPSKPTFHYAIRDNATGMFIKKSDSSSFMSLSKKPCCWTTRAWAQNAISNALKYNSFKGPLEIVTFELVITECQEPVKTKKQSSSVKSSGSTTPQLVNIREVMQVTLDEGLREYAAWRCDPTDVFRQWSSELSKLMPYAEGKTKSGKYTTARYFVYDTDYEVLWLNTTRQGIPHAIGKIDAKAWKKTASRKK